MPEVVPVSELVEATHRDPIVVAVVANGRVTSGGWRSGDTYVMRTGHRNGSMYLGIGDPRQAGQIVSALVNESDDVPRAALPRGWLEHVGPAMHTVPARDWDWFWTTSAPERLAEEGGVTWLGADDSDDIAELLRDAMPEASAWPGDDRVRRWAGLRTGDGLVACLADTSHSPAIGHLASVVTATRHQGNGFGAALTAWVTREMLRDGVEMVTLGMYADNDRARRFYERLGFTCEHQFSSAEISTRSRS